MPKNNVWPIAIGAALAGALIAGGGVWALQSGSTANLKARVVQSDAEKQAALKDEAAAIQAAEAAKTAQTPSSSAESTATGVVTKPPTTKPVKKSVTVKQFAFVKKVNVSGTQPFITADYALMLTGKAAMKAAKAHGDEANDYYIVNDNKLLRKLPVKDGISVTVTTNDDGTSDSTGHIITFAKWAAAYDAADETNASLREGPYWLTVKDGTVTKIVQQYLP